ncbi:MULTISPECIES: AraC family transcriptional regulator [Pseudoalteromonas]|uniref:AraC family transcriptional regulator n=1 Tax=Pseudoalteromonas TaxID=53246 RepID=UPI000313FEB1|nr:MULTISPECIES: helix-turn-helix domain-containing protein [Pseudoalteromonas]MDP4489674.1 helix-turn-helix domain-containing protein [Pseudoalteromonas piscicida]
MYWMAIVALIGACQSVLLAGMFVFHKQIGVARLWLAGLCFALSLVLLDSFSYQISLQQQYPHLLGLVFPLGLVFGPLLYGYVTQLLKAKVKRGLYWHFVPALVAVILLLPFYLQSAGDKALILQGDTAQLTPWYLQPGIVFIMLANFIQGPLYCYLCWDKTIKVKRTLRDLHSPQFHAAFIWIMVLLAALLCFWLLDLLYLLFDTFNLAPLPVNAISDSMIGGLIVLISVLSFQKQTLFSPALSNSAAQSTLAVVQDERGESHHMPAKYQHSALNKEIADALCQELKTHMEVDRAYLNPELSLSLLAQRTGHSTHNISQAINQSLALNFFDFVNQYRVQESKVMLLRDPSLAVLDIGLGAGFNSKSSFYAAFKKHTGATPSQFRKQHAD